MGFKHRSKGPKQTHLPLGQIYELLEIAKNQHTMITVARHTTTTSSYA